MMIRTALVGFILCGASMPVLAQEAAPPTKEWYLNGTNPKRPAPGEYRPDYFFQKVVPVDAHTTVRVQERSASLKWTSFKSVDRTESYIRQFSDKPYVFISHEWNNPVGVTLSPETSTTDLNNALRAMIPTTGAVVQVDEDFGGGYCLGKILYTGRLGFIKALPTFASNMQVASWEQTVAKEINYSPDSALCFGPVSKSPQNLQFETPDIRALKDTLLVISGLYPIDCKKKEGSETDHICEFTSKGSLLTGQQSQ